MAQYFLCSQAVSFCSANLKVVVFIPLVLFHGYKFLSSVQHLKQESGLRETFCPFNQKAKYLSQNSPCRSTECLFARNGSNSHSQFQGSVGKRLCLSCFHSTKRNRRRGMRMAWGSQTKGTSTPSSLIWLVSLSMLLSSVTPSSTISKVCSFYRNTNPWNFHPLK